MKTVTETELAIRANVPLGRDSCVQEEMAAKVQEVEAAVRETLRTAVKEEVTPLQRLMHSTLHYIQEQCSCHGSWFLTFGGN